jgi:hypothetical protein
MLTAADFLPNTFKPKVGRHISLLEPEKQHQRDVKRAQYVKECERIVNDPKYKEHRKKLKLKWAKNNRPKENKRKQAWVDANREKIRAYDREYKRKRAQQLREQNANNHPEHDPSPPSQAHSAAGVRDTAVQLVQLLPVQHSTGHPDGPRRQRALPAGVSVVPTVGIGGQDNHRPQRRDDLAPQGGLHVAC